jgi:MbtH protein
MDDSTEDTRLYRVVVNHEEQYSIWLAERDLPLGWTDAGKTGQRADCLSHINTVWTDMRPKSLRILMAAEAAAAAASASATASAAATAHADVSTGADAGADGGAR